MKNSSGQYEAGDMFKRCFSNLNAQKTDLIVLILASQQIESRIENKGGRFQILVRDFDIESAKQSVKLYFRENRAKILREKIRQLPISTFYSPAAFFIMAVLALIHWAVQHYDAQEQMLLEYGASALYILQGAAYRAVTALFLHADLQHLMGNLAGLLIFGAPLISLSGYGTGPFMLLFAGTFGNLLNAFLYRTAHLSIGASTAVMGAAGLLAAFQLTQPEKPFRFNRLVPVISGAILVAMFSHGERTDVMAHVFGFLSGLASGIVFFPLHRIFPLPHKEKYFLLVSVIIVLCAFLIKDGI